LRETLRNRLLQMTVPHYVEFTQANNANSPGTVTSGTPAKQEFTYRTFTGLVNRLQAEGTRVIVVALPVQKGYEVDPQLRELADRDVIELIDLRGAEGIHAAHYLDGMHLNTSGQQILSRALAENLADELLSSS
jgi:lysophospholipase L1-like esterase